MSRRDDDLSLAEDPLTVCHLPKHKDERWEDIIAEDRDYVEWLVYRTDWLDEATYNYVLDLLESL